MDKFLKRAKFVLANERGEEAVEKVGSQFTGIIVIAGLLLLAYAASRFLKGTSEKVDAWNSSQADLSTNLKPEN